MKKKHKHKVPLKNTRQSKCYCIDSLGLQYYPVWKGANTTICYDLYMAMPIEKDESLVGHEVRTLVMQKKYEKKYDPDLFTFTFVRNPFHRFVSAYFQTSRWFEHTERIISRKNKPLIQQVMHLREYLKDGFTFEDFVNFITDVEPTLIYAANTHWMCQSKYLNLCRYEFDFVGRVERMQEGYDYIKEKTGVDLGKPTRWNTTKKEYNYLDFYDSKIIKNKMNEYYKEDCERWGYDKLS